MMEGVNSIMLYLIYCKFLNTTMYPHHKNKRKTKQNLKSESDVETKSED
jgi:hypothetical protein